MHMYLCDVSCNGLCIASLPCVVGLLYDGGGLGVWVVMHIYEHWRRPSEGNLTIFEMIILFEMFIISQF